MKRDHLSTCELIDRPRPVLDYGTSRPGRTIYGMLALSAALISLVCFAYVHLTLARVGHHARLLPRVWFIIDAYDWILTTISLILAIVALAEKGRGHTFAWLALCILLFEMSQSGLLFH